jgi:hypothetical protein
MHIIGVQTLRDLQEILTCERDLSDRKSFDNVCDDVQ